MATLPPLSALSSLLQSSLSPQASIRREAERQIVLLQQQPGFAMLALQLAQADVLEDGRPNERSVKQGASLLFKNFVRANWKGDEESPYPIPGPDKETLKAHIVPIMISFANQPNIQVQIGEAITIMAESDFPQQWQGLLDQLLGSLSADNYITNNSVLQTAHSIFRRWRSQFRTDALFLEIKFVLEKFCQPYLALFQSVDAILSNPTPLPSPQDPKTVSKTLYLLLQIFHDLNSQDIPEFFEDNLSSFMTLLHKYLTFTRPEIEPPPPSADDDDDELPDEGSGSLEEIRGTICEIMDLYVQRYSDVFPDHDGSQTVEWPTVNKFVETTWVLLTSLGPSRRFDTLVSKATRFLSVVVRLPSKKILFEKEETLQSFCERIVLPNMNMRTFEEERFEDDPADYVRWDLQAGGTDADTRRAAATELTRALMELFSAQITKIITSYVGAHLQQAKADPRTHWKAKDTALSLLTSIAARSQTQQFGVTSTNALVDVVGFFAEHVIGDLQASPADVHPILQADAIKYLYMFRNQLTKEQLISVLPMLVPHLGNPNFVIHTYAAMTVERILSTKQNNQAIFSQEDVKPHAAQVLAALLRNIETGRTPEEIAKNEHLMKCVMRVLLTTREAIGPAYTSILQHLSGILGEVTRNPSNPRFNHYLFEAIAALIRFVAGAQPETLKDFETSLFTRFTAVLQQDVAELLPFVLQILAEMVDLQTAADLPEAYRGILPLVLNATLWEQRGNVPALVRLLKSFFSKGLGAVLGKDDLSRVVATYQFLMRSKFNDQWSCELAEALLENVSTSSLSPFMGNIFTPLLTRLSQSKTDKLAHGFTRIVCASAASQVAGPRPGVGGANEVIGAINALQPGLFVQVLQGIAVPALPSTPSKDRAIVSIGLTRLLTGSAGRVLLEEPGLRAWPATMQALLKLILLPQTASSTTSGEALASAEIEIADLEESGYQASFSRLASSEGIRESEADRRLKAVGDVRGYLGTELGSRSAEEPGKFGPLLAAVDQNVSGPFSAYLASNGITIR